MSHPLFEKHHELLAHALEAIAKRGYWSPFPENPNPRAYGDGAAEAGNGSAGAEGNGSSPEGSATGCTATGGSLDGSVGSDQGGNAIS